MLDRATLLDLIRQGEIDTVILAVPDQQGRLMGKRHTGAFFAEQVAEGGMHVCDYLLTVDLEMEPLPGYRLADWESGYGDHHVAPDWSSARRLPWQPGAALLLGDLHDHHGAPVEAAPRRILRRQIERAAALGLRPMLSSELEGYLYRDTYERAAAQEYRALTPFSRYLEDYHIFQTSREEPVLRRIRNEMAAAGVPVEGTKGEWGRGQVELNLAYADALTMADRHVVFKQGVKEICEQQGCAFTFMAKPDAAAAGSSCHIHVSLWDAAGERNGFWEEARGGGRRSRLFEQFLAGQLALARELSLYFAPNVNSYKRYQALSWAPTAVAWAEDNRTCGFRVIGQGRSCRIENRIPGADVNPYLAYAAMLAAGLHGIERDLPPVPATRGNVYAAAELPRVPTSLREAIDLWAASAAAREAFGDEVAEHYLLSARHEQAAYDRAVTDWELRRYFERI